MIIPYTQYREFCTAWNTDFQHKMRNLRFGQAFYNWADLHKMTQTPWLNKLYNASNTDAERMILSVIDYDN